MKRELIDKKKKILKRITIGEYRELLRFIEKIYLSEYSLKIMLARKSSNLFQALIELAKEEDGGRIRKLYEKKFSADKRPVIISDRALQYYAEGIRTGKYSSILIIDDIIIHGRSIARLYEEIEQLTEGNEVKMDICALVANGNDFLDKPYLNNAFIFKNMAHHEWYYVSSMIVDLFYMTGEPYTSYIPNIKFSLSSSKGNLVKRFLASGNARKLDDNNYSYANIEAYAWIAPDIWDFSLFQSIRFYINKDLNQCVIVPMVALSAINEDLLVQYNDILKELFDEEYNVKVTMNCKELSYRAMIYMISALWGRLFLAQELNCSEQLENFEDIYEEQLNFGTAILNRKNMDRLNETEISQLLSQINAVYKKMDALEILSLQEDFATLDVVFNKVISESGTNKTENPIAQIARFLYRNGNMDESLWKKHQENGKTTATRLIGYPLKTLIEKLKHKQISMQEIGFSILSAIDYGKGSIVAKMVRSDCGKNYFVSLIHAGEQNYKYIEMKYFPYIYGLYEIERICKKKQMDSDIYKSEFKKSYIEYMEKEHLEYISEELTELCEMNITDTFESVLLWDSQSYSDKHRLNDSITLVDEIVNNKGRVGHE